MCTKTPREILSGAFADIRVKIYDSATEQLDRAGGYVSWLAGKRVFFGTPYTLACAIFGTTCLFLLLSDGGVSGIPAFSTLETTCPLVCLPGLFGPNGTSFLAYWTKKWAEGNKSEHAPGKEDASQLNPEVSQVDTPEKVSSGGHAWLDGDTKVFEKLDLIPDALRQYDDLVYGEGRGATHPPDGQGKAGRSLNFPSGCNPADDVPGKPDEPQELPAVGLSIPQFGSRGDKDLAITPGLNDRNDESVPDLAERKARLSEDVLPDLSEDWLEISEDIPDLPDDAPGSGEQEAVTTPLLDEGRSIESLIGDLGSDDAMLRERAQETLVKLGADAVAHLVRALALVDEERRWCVAETLALIGEDAIPALIAALGETATQTRAAATLVRIGKPAVPSLIAALGSGDDEVQFGAHYALREIGEVAVPSLVEALGAPDGEIRRSAAEILRELGWRPPDEIGTIRHLIASEAWPDVADYGEAAIEPLISILRSPDRERWWHAARTLGEIGEASVGPLIELLRDADQELRSLVVMALGEIGLPAVNPLIRLLSDPDIREMAAAALIKVGEPSAEACVRALDDADSDVIEALCEVLYALGEAAVPPLIQALTSDRSRRHAAAILERMGWEPWDSTERAWYLIAREEWMELALMGAPAVEPLIRTLNGSDDRVRCEAAVTLGEIGLPEAVEPLVNALRDDVVAPAAADALVAIGQPAVTPVLALLDGGSDAVRENAVEILGKLRAPEAAPAIVELLRDGGDRLHRRAVDALINIGAPAVTPLIPLLGEAGDGHDGAVTALTGIGEAAVEPLTDLLTDENAMTRLGAATVLNRLGWRPGGVDEQAVYLIALQQWQDVVSLGAPAVEPLLVRLADPDTGVKAGAIKSLARIGTPAIPHLIRLLGDEARLDPAADTLVRIGEAAVEPLIGVLSEDELRQMAVGVLVRIGAPAAGPLASVLGHPNIGPIAADILTTIGAASVNALVLALGSADPLTRQRSGDILVSFGDMAVGSLIEALGHSNDTLRLEAANTLTRIGKPAIDDLTTALLDVHYAVRLGAAEVLGRIGWVPETESETVHYLIAKEQWASVAELGPIAVEPLVKALDDPDSAVQMGAARALGMIGTPAVRRLIDELRTEQEGGQRRAIEALKTIGEPAVVPLIDALCDRDWHIRLGAARALVTIGDPAVEPLVQALRNGSPVVQMGAAATLGKIGNPGAIDSLIDTLLHEDWHVGRVVVRALGMMGEEAVEPLLRVLREGNDTARMGAVMALVLIGDPARRLLPAALKDGHFRVRAGAADALDRLGWVPAPGEETAVYLIAKERWSDLIPLGTVAVGPLVAVLLDCDDSIRRRAAKVLGEIRDPSAVPALISLLHDEYYSVRREAAAALVSIGAPAMDAVVSALVDPDDDVRKRAADVLAEIGDARAVDPLRSLLNDPDWYVQRAAEDAIEQITHRADEG